MATEVVAPYPIYHFDDNNGNPLANGQLFTYAAGTTTKLGAFLDSTGTPATNPIRLNARGETPLWIPPNVAYKFVLASATDTDPPTNPIQTSDNVANTQILTLYGGVDSGVSNAYILTFPSNFTGYTDGVVIYWTPSHTNSGASTINVNGIGIVSIINADGSVLRANQLIGGQQVEMIATGGHFVLLGTSTVAPVNPLYKIAAQSNATTTVTADSHLQYTVIGNGTYAIRLVLQVTNGGAGGMKLAMTYTGTNAATSSWMAYGTANSAANTTVRTSIGTTATYAATMATTDYVIVECILISTVNGLLQFQWALNSLAGTLTLGAGSYMTVQQMS